VHILINNLEPADLPILFSEYETFTDNVQSQILIIAQRNLPRVKTQNNVSKKLVQELIRNNSTSIDERINIFVLYMSRLAGEECRICLEALGFIDIAKIFIENKRPTIKIDEKSRKLMNALKTNGFIESFEEDKNANTFKKIRRRKNKQQLPIELL